MNQRKYKPTFGGSTTIVFERFATDPSVGSNPRSPHEDNLKRTKEGFARSSLASRFRRKTINEIDFKAQDVTAVGEAKRAAVCILVLQRKTLFFFFKITHTFPFFYI